MPRPMLHNISILTNDMVFIVMLVSMLTITSDIVAVLISTLTLLIVTLLVPD